MREILPGVLTWPWFSERFQYDFNGYLVRHPDGALVVDPVETSPEVLEAIAAESPRTILLTNRNHFRDAEKVRARTGATVRVHDADRAFVEGKGVVVGGSMAAGDRVGPFTVIDASGKSPGEVALHWPERKLLLVGDAVVCKPPAELRLLPDAVIDDKARLVASLRRIAGTLELDALLVADGASILDGAGAALQAFVRVLG